MTVNNPKRIPTDLDIYKAHLDVFLTLLNLGVAIFDELPEGDYNRKHLALMVANIEQIQKRMPENDELMHRAMVLATRRTIQRTRELLQRSHQLPKSQIKTKISWMKAAKTALQESKGVGR